MPVDKMVDQGQMVKEHEAQISQYQEAASLLVRARDVVEELPVPAFFAPTLDATDGTVEQPAQQVPGGEVVGRKLQVPVMPM